MGLGERIKEVRKGKALNQTVFAERIGVTQAALSLYEKGLSNPKLEVIESIYTAFPGVDLHWLITGELISRNISQGNNPDLDECRKTNEVLKKAIEMLYDQYREGKK